MGRRSISSTKAGKFMNPTDQARKEARRRELKKNKKQRLQVRQAVIKQKDPKHIMTELEQLDRLEYDSNNPPPYSVKVLQDKRRKLKETWTKMHQFYLKEDPKLAGELKSLEFDYERKRHQMVTLHESIMQAQKVKVDDIPLPDNIPMPGEILMPDLPSEVATKSILKNKKETVKFDKEPPGAPPGSPPSLSEFEDDEDLEPNVALTDASKSSKNQNQEKAKKLRFSETTLVNPAYGSYLNPALVPPTAPGGVMIPPPPPPPPPPQPQIIPPQHQPYQPRTIQQQPVRNQAYYQPPPPPSQPHQRTTSGSEPQPTHSTTYEAKPVLRNKMAEVTKFVPTSLMVKRDTKKPSSSSLTSTTTTTTTTSNAPQSNLNLTSHQANHGPFNYMLQQQQQYATLNPVRSSFSTIDSSNQQQRTQVQQKMNAPSAKRIEPTDLTYESFMKEIGKLL